jgi:hypothetical protein
MEQLPRPRVLVPVSNKHTVTPGQDWGHVASIHGVSQEDLKSHPENRHIVGSGPLLPGTRLTIPFMSRNPNGVKQ